MTDAAAAPFAMDPDTELAFLLARAGVSLTPAQFAGVASEWPGFRAYVDLVNQPFDAAEEPSTIFDVTR